jgi:branched-chain amino acid transport system permease protein
MVDSPAMTELSGTNPSSISVGVWAVSMFFAGLAGVLAAPIIGLDPGNFTLLVAAAFAAVVAARLRSLPIAISVGLAMGVATALIQYLLPPSSHWTTEIVDAVPFAFIAVFIVYNLILKRDLSESQQVGGALDTAITPQGESQLAGSAGGDLEGTSLGFIGRYGGPLLLIVICALLPLIVQGLWVNLLDQAFAYAIIFLSFTLVTGEGGMIWLCEITFAGIGGLISAQLSVTHHWPVLLAIIAGGLITLPVGLLVGYLTIRLGGLYVALITLTFGLLVENLFFTLNVFTNNGLGVQTFRPSWASGDLAYAYVCLAAFCIIALFVMNLRRSTTGLALNAVRWSEPGSRTLGISVVQMKIIVAGLAAMVAGLGGGFLITAQTSAQPGNFSTFIGVIWLAVLVTIGVRSNAAALVAGVRFALFPAIVLAYLPAWTASIPTLLFGLGAIGAARYPNGTLAQNGEMFRSWLIKRANRKQSPGEAAPAVATASESAKVEEVAS